ncbi:hypothetical protein OG417_44055 [Actinoallomurus sp. NBC_01490]|uniref:hypothetical protein n=1 Tax=Actinoallomurus sp. NBC_01490 TaxID=2903557 RepID=UPI002E2F5B92|nr:hypothetical protein [Actinoallomurus sp. NBC_01490]
MWHGDPGPGRRPLGWAEMDRFVDGQRARQAPDDAADSRAKRFTESLEDAVLDIDAGAFERARRKTDHVEELRRVLGLLLDVLADWEMLAARAGDRLK